MRSKSIYTLLLFFAIISATSAFAGQVVDISVLKANEILAEVETEPIHWADNTVTVQPKLKKLKAVLLAIFLGHFGVHRIYLGTKPNVPVVYSLTLGGGLGLLPLLDIIAILNSKDLSEFSNNDKVFMWSKSATP